MFHDKRFLVVVALVAGLACVYIQAAVPDDCKTARDALGAAKTLVDWKTALDKVDAITASITATSTNADKANLAGLIYTGANNVDAALSALPSLSVVDKKTANAYARSVVGRVKVKLGLSAPAQVSQYLVRYTSASGLTASAAY